MRPSKARQLILEFTTEGETIFEPFAGAGTIALEAFAQRRNVICSDLNPYAVLLTRAKLYPPRDCRRALESFANRFGEVQDWLSPATGPTAPHWIRKFFHPRTLREAIALSELLRERGDYFLTACLMGILHHQRPGFLSFPSNHLVPYLLTRKYPRADFADLYAYRPVRPRMEAKVLRAYRNFPRFDYNLTRKCYHLDAMKVPLPEHSIDAVITSPPYMDNLDYYRDNRLRLWFLGIHDYHSLQSESPRPGAFNEFMFQFFKKIYKALVYGGYCVLVLGDVTGHSSIHNCAKIARDLAVSRLGLFRVKDEIVEEIPLIRRSRPRYSGTRFDTTIVLQKV